MRLYKDINFQLTNEEERKNFDTIFSMHVENENIFIVKNLAVSQNNFKNRSFYKYTNQLKLCFLGRISPVKNLDFALAVLNEIGYDVSLDIFGPIENEDYWSECKRLIKKLPRNIVINYNGSLNYNEVKSIFLKFHFLFLPTFGENFGHSIFESLSMGCPVLISNRTPWRDLQKDKCGFDLPLPNKSKFCDAINYLYKMDNCEYKEWSHASHNRAMKYASNEKTIKEYFYMFDQI